MIDLLSHFGSIFGAFFHHLCFQKYVTIGKGDFMKMSFSCTRGAHFQGFRPPRSIQKSLKKRSKNGTLFWTAFGRFGEPFCDHFGIKIASKNRSKNQCDFGSIFWAHPGVHVGSPSGSGMPPGRPQDAPRRSQDAPKMLPRRSRMPIRHPKRPQERPTHLQARFYSNFDRFSLIFHWFSIKFLLDFPKGLPAFFLRFLGLFSEYSGSILTIF